MNLEPLPSSFLRRHDPLSQLANGPYLSSRAQREILHSQRNDILRNGLHAGQLETYLKLHLFSQSAPLRFLIKPSGKCHVTVTTLRLTKDIDFVSIGPTGR